MKLTLTETRKVNGKTLEIYGIGRYTVRVVTHESGYRNIEVRNERDDYLPSIYCRDNCDGEALGFEVQTTSYGSLQADEIRKIIVGLEEAAQVAEILAAEFVR